MSFSRTRGYRPYSTYNIGREENGLQNLANSKELRRFLKITLCPWLKIQLFVSYHQLNQSARACMEKRGTLGRKFVENVTDNSSTDKDLKLNVHGKYGSCSCSTLLYDRMFPKKASALKCVLDYFDFTESASISTWFWTIGALCYIAATMRAEGNVTVIVTICCLLGKMHNSVNKLCIFVEKRTVYYEEDICRIS